VAAAVDVFAERGFGGASTREIAARAGVNQGLITHHFGSKELLWRAAVGQTFEGLRRALQRDDASADPDPKAHARQITRQFVRFAAAHPEFFRLMVDNGRVADDRLRWVVDTHLRPAYEEFGRFGATAGFAKDPVQAAHVYYLLAGAASLMFVVGPECAHLTGLDPTDPATVEHHADLVAALFVP
ncbi:MAG: TetR/AcrR family transcriptional regulator, partial [Myxococcota bacterium]